VKEIFPTSKQVALALILVAIIAATVFIFAFSQEGLPTYGKVEYSMTGYDFDVPGVTLFDFNPYGQFFTKTMPNTYTVINKNTPLMVDLTWQNTGNVDVALKLILTVENANITWYSNFGSNGVAAPSWPSESDGQAYNGTTVTFVSVTKANSTAQNRYIDIFPVGSPSTFTITFSMKETSKTSALLLPTGNTTATYALTNSSIYKLLN
jgi:hypothetical protein